MKNFISVIIPVYNAEKHLKKCIDSILDQNYTSWEVIAIDDGSKDSSYRILRTYALNDTRIKVATKANEGPGLTRNRALDRAKGNFIIFLDADDYIEPTYFELLNEKVNNEDADVIFINVIQEDIDGKVIKYERMSKFKNYNRKDMIGCQMTGYMPWGGCRKAVSRSLLEKNSLRYSSDMVGEEAIFSFELLYHAKKISFIEENLYHYVNHQGSQSKTPNASLKPILDKMRDHLKNKGIAEEYAECLNAFAFTVLILWLLGVAKKESVFDCKRMFENKITNFKKEYGWEIKRKHLRKEIRPLIFIIKNGFLLPVVIIAKLLKR